MNWDQIRSNWKTVCDTVKVTWGKLSEDDLTAIAGRRDAFVRMMQARYGYERAYAVEAVDKFARRLEQ